MANVEELSDLPHHFQTQPQPPPRTPSPSTLDDQRSGTQSSSSDDDAIHPRGRAATRMQAHNSSSMPHVLSSGDQSTSYKHLTPMTTHTQIHTHVQHDQHDSSSEDEPIGDAYQRIRERLMGQQTASVSEGGVPIQQDTSDAHISPIRKPSSSPHSGLFVTPSPERPERSISQIADDSDPDSVLVTQPTSRLQQLLARRRQEREELERERDAFLSSASDDELVTKPKVAKKRFTKAKQQGQKNAIFSPSPEPEQRQQQDQGSDMEVGAKLTQQSKPTRKASKKALEEMKRETQRMTRNMQLAHEARTRSKFTTEDFFKKFNFRQAALPQQQMTNNPSSSSPARNNSDGEVTTKDTPPSSPPSAAHNNTAKDTTIPTSLSLTVVNSDRLLTPKVTKPSVRKFAKQAKKQRSRSVSSDDELVIVDTKPKSRIAAFDSLSERKANGPESAHVFRALAQLNHRDNVKTKRGEPKSLTANELQMQLKQKAREQALLEKQEKIEALRAKGIIVQTAEEKERDQLQLENMLEKAREEAEELRKREKEARKREGKEEEGNLPDSEDEDEDWDEDLDGVEGKGSGSEDDEQSDSKGASDAENGEFVDELAVEGDEDEDAVDSEVEANEATSEVSGDEETQVVTAEQPTIERRRKRKTLVDSDDEADGPTIPISEQPQAATPAPKIVQTPASKSMRTPGTHRTRTPQSATAAAFGFGQKQSPGLGLSQVFAGTMAESQDYFESDTQQDSLNFLRDLPLPDLPNFGAEFAGEAEHGLVQDSQLLDTQTQPAGIEESQPVQFETQTPRAPAPSQMSEVPDATQDEGFQFYYSPTARPSGRHGESQATFSTIPTQPMEQVAGNGSPAVARKGRLHRRPRVHVSSSDAEVSDLEKPTKTQLVSKLPDDVFSIMRDAAQKEAVQPAYDRKKSKAKDMFEEQAEESEDEYAGLGGASDDDSNSDVDEDTKKMIDDEMKEKLNERELAAFYADKERAEDEKRVEKLFKDIANGGLRRKRGAELDLWDSDDEDEAAARRRAAKQREFAKMRRALLADEKLGKIAENPKQAAFLQAIEDREEDDELSFLEGAEEPSQIPDSQQQQQDTEESVLGPTTGNALKRKHPGDDLSGSENRTAPALRRSGKATKPTSLADIRNTLSEIIGEPTTPLDSQEDESDDEDLRQRHDLSSGDEEVHSTPDPDVDVTFKSHNPRRTQSRPKHSTVIDRIALRRASSRSLSTEGSGDRMAFHAPGRTAGGTFKVPSLLRRATTNASNASADSTTDTTSGKATKALHTGGMGAKVIKMGGSKKSSINYHVRETERRAKVEAAQKERARANERVGKMRRAAVNGLGSLAGGTFGV